MAVKDVVMEPTMKTLSDDLVRPCQRPQGFLSCSWPVGVCVFLAPGKSPLHPPSSALDPQSALGPGFLPCISLPIHASCRVCECRAPPSAGVNVLFVLSGNVGSAYFKCRIFRKFMGKSRFSCEATVHGFLNCFALKLAVHALAKGFVNYCGMLECAGLPVGALELTWRRPVFPCCPPSLPLTSSLCSLTQDEAAKEFQEKHQKEVGKLKDMDLSQ